MGLDAASLLHCGARDMKTYFEERQNFWGDDDMLFSEDLFSIFSKGKPGDLGEHTLQKTNKQTNLL